MTERLAGKIALITGAGRGIGLAIAQAMAREGATVVLGDIDADALQSHGATIGGSHSICFDVTDEAAWTSAAGEIGERHGRLDILVNNAGIEISRPIEMMSFADWRRIMAVNVDAAFLGCRAMLPLLREAGARRQAGAAIVNLGSVAALIGFPNQVGYNASKAALRHLARSLAVEWGAAGYNIRANTIHPGPTRTQMVEEYVAAEIERGGDADAIWQTIAGYSPLKRIGRVEDIAMGVVYLASDEAGFVNGTDLVIDGGMVAR